MNVHQLITSPFRVSSLATSKKGMQVESSCSRWKGKPTMGTEPRSEDEHVVMVMVRQVTVTGGVTLLVLQPKPCE